MNLVRQYEFGYIAFEELESELWNFGPNAIQDVGEKWFQFYVEKSCGYHSRNYYIEEWLNGIESGNSQ